MDTQKRAKEISRFIILIPHRDALRPLDEFRRRLFYIGVNGAHSFPQAAALALVSRPFCREELKELARNIRNLTRGTEGKIHSDASAFVCCPAGLWRRGRKVPAIQQKTAAESDAFLFFGPLLNLPSSEDVFPQPARGKILKSLLPPVLCAALVNNELHKKKTLNSEVSPAISFRAAALANLAIRPLDGADYSFEWKTGPFVWLPAFKAE